MPTRLAFARLRNDRRGVTAVEYALMCGLIAAGIIAAVTTLQGNIIGVFATIGSAL
jgi:pilus assembly protein Flp/PilA